MTAEIEVSTYYRDVLECSPSQLAALWSELAIQSDPDFLLDSMVGRPNIRVPASERSGLTSGSVIKL